MILYLSVQCNYDLIISLLHILRTVSFCIPSLYGNCCDYTWQDISNGVYIVCLQFNKDNFQSPFSNMVLLRPLCISYFDYFDYIY